MNFDLRLPIGILFSFYGVILVGYGLITKAVSSVVVAALTPSS